MATSPFSGDLIGLDKGLVLHYGFIGALLIHHFIYWIKKNGRKGKNLHDGRTWTYQTKNDIQEHFYFCTYKQIRTALDHLIEKGVLLTANYNQRSGDQTIWYAFNEEKMFGVDLETLSQEKSVKPKDISQSQSSGPNGQGSAQMGQALPKSKTQSPFLQKEQDLEVDRALSSKRKTVFKGQEAPFQKRWRLTDEQMATFNWLKSLNTETTEGTLIWWAKNFTKERLESAYNQAKQGAKDSVGGYMNLLLKKTNPVVSEHTATNREMAEEFKKSENWTALKIHQDKVSCKIHTGSIEDVMLHLDPIYFMSKLISLKEIC